MTPTRIWRIGLTGGIGSGKSTVASMLADRGAVVIDADAISRSLTAAGGRAIPEIRRRFGDTMVGPDGAMDRQAMRSKVFTEPQARQQLESIIHPLVAQITHEQAQSAVKEGTRCIVHDVPLLVESGERWRSQVDRVLVVDCDPTVQRERVVARNGLTPQEVDRIMAQQATRAQRLACADLVTFNQALSLDALRQQVGLAARHFGL